MKIATALLIVSALELGLVPVRVSGAEPWARQQQAVPIPMRDGQSLVADVYLPEAPGRYPTILVQTPYSRKRLAAALADDRARERLFDRDHYAVVVLDWRGFYDSKAARKGTERLQIGKAREFVSDPRKPVPTVGGANLGQDSRADVPSSLLASTRPAGSNLARDDAAALLAGPQDQAEVERRDDVLVYTTAVLKEPLRIFGRARVNLTFAADQKDASLAVRLCDVYPDGRSTLVCDSIVRARYRERTDESVEVEPGQTYTASLRLPPFGLTIAGGHRLRISIAGSNYPRYELNPHTGADHYDAGSAVAARYSVFHGGSKPSALIVPVLESP